MNVGLQFALSDPNLPIQAAVTQRQLAISLWAIAPDSEPRVPLNLCLVLDHSHSMRGNTLETVKLAAQQLVSRLGAGDRISIIGFDHQATVLVPNQVVEHPAPINAQIAKLQATGGTAIDEGLRLGIEELLKGRVGTVSQLLLLTDGENEHGSNGRCVKLAQQSVSHSLTLNTLGLGEYWNQDLLEEIADTGGGSLSYIQYPDQAVEVFYDLLKRARAVALTNAYLEIAFVPQVRLATFKPIAQVIPETIELPVYPDGQWLKVRIGDLMTHPSKVILANVYIHQLSAGHCSIASLQVRYDAPGFGEKLYSDMVNVTANTVQNYQANPDPDVQRHVLKLAKYRQTQIAEAKLLQGDRLGAATMLQTAAKTALQLGEDSAVSILEENAARLEKGDALSEVARKKTRMAAKTTLM
jgi:Ca-activated chloride channel homolog